ncbi:MAG: hypothetical protein KME32_12430 [Mojavia pulchra JT2-VF2]|jgi:hypothetical protein|uniref:Uncharacterized protein n=1 Tax=Mojavia pulchra JT2-VF2 TaxID=287848 RepID=A0A951UHA0_9NOST|nr:hypothetical protein [Mojavia pulchra JT2-VF2]
MNHQTYKLLGAKRCVFAISIASLTTLLAIGPTAADSPKNPIIETQTKQLRPTRITSEEISQVKQVLPRRNILVKHAFRINLPDFGSCLFVPIQEFPQGSKKAKLSLYLVKNKRVLYTLPQSQQVQPWNFLALKAVSFLELDFDGPDEDGILLIGSYMTSDFPSSRNLPLRTPKPFPVAILYHRKKNGFEVYEDISKKLTQRQVKTITEAKNILRRDFGFIP